MTTDTTHHSDTTDAEQSAEIEAQSARLEEELAESDTLHGNDSTQSLEILMSLGLLWCRSAHYLAYEAADSYFDELVDRCIDTYGEEHESTARALVLFGRNKLDYGHHSWALEILVEALRFFTTRVGNVPIYVTELRELVTTLTDALTMIGEDEIIEFELGLDDDDELEVWPALLDKVTNAVDSALQAIPEASRLPADEILAEQYRVARQALPID